jgi:uncharacterized protein (DUF1330 family)
MAAYVIATIEVTEPEGYEEYRRRVPATIEKYGGRYLVRGGRSEVAEGIDPNRVVVLEFSTIEKAREWYNSPEYQACAPIRQEHSRTGFLVLVEGFGS